MKLPDRGATRALVIPNSGWATIVIVLGFHLARASHEPSQHDNENDLLANLQGIYEQVAGHQKQAKPASAMSSPEAQDRTTSESTHNSSEFNYVSIIEHLYLELLDEFASFRGALEGLQLARELPAASLDQKTVLKRVHRAKRQAARSSLEVASPDRTGLLDAGKILQTDGLVERAHESRPEPIYKLVRSQGSGLSNVTHLSMRRAPIAALLEDESRSPSAQMNNEAPRVSPSRRHKRVDSSQELERELEKHLSETSDASQGLPGQLEPDEPHEPVGIGGSDQNTELSTDEPLADTNHDETNRTRQGEAQSNETGDTVELNTNQLASSPSIVHEPDKSQKSAALVAETYEPSQLSLANIERIPYEIEPSTQQDTPPVGYLRVPHMKLPGVHPGDNSRRRDLLNDLALDQQHSIGQPQTGEAMIARGTRRPSRRSAHSLAAGSGGSGSQLLSNLASVSNQLTNEELARLASLLSSNLPDNQASSTGSSIQPEDSRQLSAQYGPLAPLPASRPDMNEDLFYDTQASNRAQDRRVAQFLVRPSRTQTKQTESVYSASPTSQPAKRKPKPTNSYWSHLTKARQSPNYTNQMTQSYAASHPQLLGLSNSGSKSSLSTIDDQTKNFAHARRQEANLIRANWLLQQQQQQQQANQVGAGPIVAGQQASRPQSGYKLSPFAAAGTYLLPAFATVPYSSTTARFGDIAASPTQRLGSASSDSAGSIGRVGPYYDDTVHGPTSASAQPTPRAHPHSDPMWSDTQNQEEDYKQSPQTIQITAVPNGLGLGNGLGLNGFNGWNGLNGWNGWNGPWNGRQVLLVNRQPSLASNGEWRQWILPVAVVLALPLVLGALFVPVFLKSVMFLIQILQMLGLLMPPGQLASQIGSSSHSSG